MISEIKKRITENNETGHRKKDMKGQIKSHMCDTVKQPHIGITGYQKEQTEI